ncbi:MAG: hypothetical protein KatS3mg057_1034 [Herpetosiphonaceae bacterium]|nr:MAG: hypothetical protein KatS3mg057_1034 [Herpetosiphonaceae bacterium]
MGNVSSIVDNRSSSNSQSFGYDHCDRLISWTLGGATQSYAWEEVVGGAIKTAYEFDEKLVAVRASSAGVSYLHGDHLGSVRLATNASATLLSQ